ncbi:hypothetical protein PTKIN_Ptkin19aG0049700 [Pterospermum kingtungense]
MKESSVSRLQKNCPNPPRKLKLVCSFNGAFHPRPPSGKLRYIGGESRIISVDRNIGFLKLRAKVADLCPKALSFWLKYQVVVVADVDLDMDMDMSLVVIESDEDVKCMMEEYENVESHGKKARLWVYVCSNGVESEQFFKGQVDYELTKNFVGSGGGNGLRHGYDSLRKMVMKQQLLGKQTSGISGTRGVSGLAVNESGNNQKFDHPLVDLGNLFDCETNLGPQMCPLKHMDGNLSVQYNSKILRLLPGKLGGRGFGVLKQPNNSGMISMCNCFDSKHDLVSSEQRSLSNFNIENIMPWAHLEPEYYNKWGRNPHNAKSGEAFWGSSQNHLQNRRNDLFGIGNHGIIKLDVKFSSGKYLGVKTNSNISKQGRSCGSSMRKPCPGLPEHASSEACHLAYYGALAGLGCQPLLADNVSDCSSPGIRMVDAKRHLIVGSNYRPDYQTPSENCHAAAICCEPIHCGLQNRPSVADSQDVITNSALSNDAGYSNGTEYVCNDQLPVAEECKNLESNFKDGDGTHNLQAGICSSIDLFSSLSLSSSKVVQPPALSSHDSNNVIDALIMPQSYPSHLLDEVHVEIGFQVDKSSGNTSNMDELKKDYIATQDDFLSDISIDEKSEAKNCNKWSKVIGRISSDLTAFPTHLGTREVQTIKSSDLEYLKELGAGAYGTVFYGKWKGSDVAIKRLKLTCFSQGSVEEERLVADFWREACILGQLHHPNIMALYGVVTGGPITSLAMVAEYMVNGSLRQVLRRKDRYGIL